MSLNFIACYSFFDAQNVFYCLCLTSALDSPIKFVFNHLDIEVNTINFIIFEFFSYPLCNMIIKWQHNIKMQFFCVLDKLFLKCTNFT